VGIKASEGFYDFLRNEEGFVEKAQPDLNTGKLAVGFGKQTTNPNEVVTREKADSDMRLRVKEAEDFLSSTVKREDLTQGQQDALVDMHYNLGPGGMKNFIDLVNARKDAEASQELLSYTKAFDKKLGMKVEVDVLKKRVQKRKAMWDQLKSAQAASSSNVGIDALLDQAIAEVDAPQDQPDLVANAIKEVEEGNFELAQEADPERRKQGLSDASVIANVEEVTRHNEAKRLSDQYGMSYQEARDRLALKPFKDVVAEQGHALIAENFPEVAEWVDRDPNNYVMLRESGNWAPKTVTAARKLNPDTRGDWEKALAQNPLMIKESLTYLGMMTGHLSKSEASNILSQIDEERQANALTSKASQSFQKLFFDKNAGLIDKLKAVSKFPEPAMQVMAQSQGSTAAIMGSALAGTVAGGPAAGAISAYTASHILSFSEHMTKQLDDFRDPITGKPNIDLAFSDPARVQKWIREADIYGLTMGVSDALFSLVGGKLGNGVSKHVMKKPGVAQKVVTAGVEVGGKAVEEGASQIAALQAVDLHRGDGLKNLEENYKEGLDEAILSTGPAAGMTGIKYGAIKTAQILSKASKANEDLAAVSELRAQIEKNPEVKNNPEATKELIKQALNKKPVSENPNDPIIDDPESIEPSVEQEIVREANTDVVRISPVELEAHFGSRDEAMKFVIEKLPPSLRAEYAQARESDTSIAIPISDWIFITEDRPELDAVARFNGNEYNGLEANAQIEMVEKKPTVFFDRTAFHGSPHDFDRFREGAIGTGEGAQAYGYGLYFSTDPNVAEWYRKSLIKADTVPGEVYKIFEDNNFFGFDSHVEALSAFRQDDNWEKTWDAESLPAEQIKTIQEYVDKTKNRKKGQVFEVKLPKGLWVDLDSTLDSVPPEIEKSIRDSLIEAGISDKGETEPSTWGMVGTYNPQPEYFKKFLKGEPINKEFVTLGLLLSSLTHEQDKKFAITLTAKGFNGITYKGLESGKQNFVVFTEDDVKIVKKFYERAEGNDAAPNEDGGTIEIIEADPNDPQNLKLRPVQLYNKFRSDEEKKVFFSILSRLKRSLPKDTDEQMIEAWTEIQFGRMQHRATLINRPFTEVAKQLKIGKTTGKSKLEAYGTFSALPKKDAPYTVAFTFDGENKADVKTIIHEFGHSYLHEMAIDYEYVSAIPEESMTEQQRAYLDSMRIAAEAFGLDSIDQLLNMDPVQEERIHETFARTAELYFLEGKLENTAMARLLSDFRKYVVAVIERIKSIFNTSVYPPLKITPKIERMFEGILGASNALEEQSYPMFPEPLFSADMLGKDGQKYIELIKDARSEALGRGYTKIWNKSIREREVLIDKELDRITQEATDEVDSRRAMLMLAQFKDAYNEFRTDPEGNTPDPRLSFDSVLKVLCNNDMALAEKIKELVPREMMTGKKKGGLPVEAFMQMNGITSPNEMLDLLTETAQRDSMIEELIDQKIKTEFPTIKTEDEIHEVVVNELQRKGKERLLLEEVKILMTKFPGKYKALIEKLINPPAYVGAPSKEAFKAEGNRMVLDAGAFKFTAKKYLDDMGRHGRDAARSFRKNNIMEALDSKMKEALHFFAYKTAVKAQKAIAQTTARIKTFDKYARSKDLARRYDTDVMSFGKQIIQLAAIGQRLPRLERSDVSELSGITDDMIELVNSRLNNYERVAAGRYGRNASVAGYVSLGGVLKTIQSVARQSKEIELGERRENIVNIAEAIENEIKDGNVVDVSSETLSGKLRRDTLNLRSVFESLYPSPEAFAKSALGKVFYKVVDSEAVRTLALMGYRDRLSALMKEASIDRGIIAPLVTRLPVPSTWKMDYVDKSSRPIIAKELGDNGFIFKNRGELHMAMLLMGSESGAKKFLLGHGIAKFNQETLAMEPDYASWNTFVERMISEGNLTKKDFDMYNGIWAIFEEIHPLVKKAMRRSDHFNMGKIEAWEVKNSLGTFTGGYVPVAGLQDIMTAGKIDSMMNVDSMGYSVNELYPNMNTGMTNERDENYGPLNLDMSRISSYLSASLNLAYLRNPLLDFGKVIESEPVRRALETRRPGIIGNAKEGIIVRWFNAVKMQEYTEYKDGFHQSMARHLRNNVNTAMYLGGFLSVVKQYFGYLPAAARLDKKGFGVMGLGRLIAANVKTGMGARKESRKFMTDRSPVMRARMSDSQEMMVRSFEKINTNFDWISWTAEKVNDFRWFFIQMTQNQVDVCTWHAAYELGKEKGLSEQDAVHYADDMVNASQSSPDVSSMSNISRGDDLHKLLMMVTSVPIAMHNLMQVETMRDQSRANKIKAVLVIGMLAWIVPNLIDGMFAESTKEDDEEDEDEALARKMKAMTTRAALGSIDTALPFPLVRMVTSSIQFGSGSASPGLSKPVNSVAKSIQASKNISKGVDLSAKDIAGLMDTITITTGLPTSLIGKMVGWGENLKSDEQKEDEAYMRKEQQTLARMEE